MADELAGPPPLPPTPAPKPPIPATDPKPAKVFIGFAIPSTIQHWVKTTAAVFIGAFAGSVYSVLQTGAIPADSHGWIKLGQQAAIGAVGTTLAYLKTSPAAPPPAA